MKKNGIQVAEVYIAKDGKNYIYIKVDNELLVIEVTDKLEEKTKKVYNGDKVTAIFNENGELIDYFKA